MALGNHRYWRVGFMKNQTSGNDFNQLCEFYMRATVGGANLIPTASSASSVWSAGNSPDKCYDGNASTFWMQNSGADNPDCWIAFDYGSAKTPRELYLKASTGDIFARSLRTANLYYSDTGLTGPWTFAFGIGFGTWTADGQVQIVDMGTPAVNERAYKAGFVVSALPTPILRGTKAGFVTVYNIPSQFLLASKAGFVPVTLSFQPLRVTKAGLVAVVRGRVSHPNVCAWTASLDGHDYYFLQLQEETLVYDFHAERWYCWGSGDDKRWNAQIGQNWNANIGAIISGIGGGERTSNILVGDGTTSMLYFLDPELSEDYSSDGVPGKAFARIVTGQLVARGSAWQKLGYVDVSSSEGDTVTAANLDVDLQISDDQGHTYWSVGLKTVVLGSYSNVLTWRSLGSYKSPGRLLRLKDYGALVRVDDWTMPDDDDG